MKRIWAVLPAWALAACQTVPYVAPEVPVPGQWAHQAPAVVPGAAGTATQASEGSASLADRPWAQVFPVPELTA